MDQEKGLSSTDGRADDLQQRRTIQCHTSAKLRGCSTHKTVKMHSLEYIALQLQDWTLQIKFVQDRDAGWYECQVSTHPPTSIFLELRVVGKFAIKQVIFGAFCDLLWCTDSFAFVSGILSHFQTNDYANTSRYLWSYTCKTVHRGFCIIHSKWSFWSSLWWLHMKFITSNMAHMDVCI